MTRYRRSALVLLTLISLVLVASMATAAIDDRPWEAGFLVGAGFTNDHLAGDSRDWEVTPVFGVRAARFFGDSWQGFFDFTRVNYRTDLTTKGRAPLNAGRIGADFFLNPGATWPWFVSASAGYMGSSLGHSVSTGENLGFNRPFGSVGFGMRRAGEATSFRWEIRGDRSLSRSDNLGVSVSQLQALVGFCWGFGGSPKDTDGDGVVDRKDKCPGTPAGARVDANGCPIDTDGDGVFDGLDKCPDTPKGWPVDASGCPLDSDGDGVPDGKDACPNTPKGAKVDERGCPTDSDGDGVFDGIDQCPDTPRGAKVDERGCPADSDGDGVLDGIDQCPGTPKGVKVDAKGCPIPEPSKAAPLFPEGKKALVLENVHFATDSASLTPDSSATLDSVAASLKDWPDVKIEIQGHTDSTGGHAHNMKLSQQRAESVRDYFVRKGIDRARLAAKGYGETKPIADNKTTEGKAKNRRVELARID